MATTGKIIGKDLVIYYGGTAQTHSTSCSISLAVDTISATTKDSANWADILLSTRSWSGSSDAAIALDATYGVEDLWGIVNTESSVTVKFATSDATDRFFSGTAYLTGLDLNADNESLSSYSVSFTGTGKLTYAAT
jgi:predicted secreted protein